MKNRLVFLLVALVVVAAICASCKDNTLPPELAPENIIVPENNSETVSPDEGEKAKNNKITDNEQMPEQNATVDDGIKENIQKYEPTAENNPENEYSISDITDLSTFDNSKYSIFEIYDGQNLPLYGVVDIDGNFVFEPQSEYLRWCGGVHRVIGVYLDYSGNQKKFEPVELDGYTIAEHGGHGGTIAETYINDETNDKKYYAYCQEGGWNAEEIAEIPELSPYIVYNGGMTVVGENGFFTEEFNRYFDEYYWGGENFEYEFTDSRGNTVYLGYCDNVPFEFSNGYIAFTRGGKYGYIDEYGEPVTEFVYDDAETAYDGFAWVCENGEWKTINLERN